MYWSNTAARGGGGGGGGIHAAREGGVYMQQGVHMQQYCSDKTLCAWQYSSKLHPLIDVMILCT